MMCVDKELKDAGCRNQQPDSRLPWGTTIKEKDFHLHSRTTHATLNGNDGTQTQTRYVLEMWLQIFYMAAPAHPTTTTITTTLNPNPRTEIKLEQLLLAVKVKPIRVSGYLLGTSAPHDCAK